MKNIKLTEEHKSKLLEMCKELFPDYFNWKFGDNWDYDELWFSWKENNRYKNNEIHWFEFCITHLCDKIASNLTNEMCTGMPQYYDESEKLDWNSQSLISMLKECHPIDYLYEEFKKLK